MDNSTKPNQDNLEMTPIEYKLNMKNYIFPETNVNKVVRILYTRYDIDDLLKKASSLK